MKRIGTILLAVVLCLSLLPVGSAVRGATVEDLSYVVSGGKVTITECKKTASGELVIPETIKGYPVTAIKSYAFYDCPNLTGVTIPSGVTDIGDNAFYYCKSLAGIWVHKDNPAFSSDSRGVLYNKDKTVLKRAPECLSGAYRMPDTVTRIEGGAFSDCLNLTDVTISENITNVGNNAFCDCFNLQYHTYDVGNYLGSESNPYLVLVKAGESEDGNVAIHPKTRILYFWSMCYYDNLVHTVIPEGVVQIGALAFSGCDNLTSINIPANVTHIENHAFEFCTGLREIYFSGDAPTYEVYTFTEVDAIGYYHAGTKGWDTTPLSHYFDLQEVAHIWLEYTYDNNHTCTKDGTERAVCRTCGVVDVRKVPGSAAHRMTYTSNQDATCTSDGTKTGTCRVCGITETVTEKGSAFGHTFSPYVSNHDATCTVDGTKTAVCGTCGSVDTVTDKGTATGHAYSDHVSNRDATCTADGTKSAICANCGKVNTIVDQGSALGHSFTEYVSDGNATCFQDGTETAKCDRCDAVHMRIQVGSADHWYIGGSCLWCNQEDPDPRQAVLTGTLTTGTDDEALLMLTAVGRDTPPQTLTVTDGPYAMTTEKGQYLLTVSKKGSVTRTYNLTLTGGENLQTITLYQPGDVSADGQLTVGDVALLYTHVRGNELTDSYTLQCADVSGDGKINILDVAMLYAHVKEV